MAVTPLAAAGVRSAWLVMGSQTIYLENVAAGYFCTSLDLGYPATREVISNKPDQDGADDRTRYMGPRTVSADITALKGAGAQIDAVLASFGPFMVPSARPVLHYVLDRPGVAERVLTLRPSGFAGPIAGPFQRDIQLQWVAADPTIRDPTVKTAASYAGASASPGRAYSLTFNRIYPPGGGAPSSGSFQSPGDLPVRPLIRIYGPITSAKVAFSPGSQVVALVVGTIISSGQWLDVDTANKTAVLNSDPTQPRPAWIDYNATSWPVLTPLPDTWTFLLSGSSTSGVTQAQVIWQDGYLT